MELAALHGSINGVVMYVPINLLGSHTLIGEDYLRKETNYLSNKHGERPHDYGCVPRVLAIPLDGSAGFPVLEDPTTIRVFPGAPELREIHL
jgi:hypothetical protein